MYAISVDGREDASRLRRELDAEFVFLSDPEGISLDLLNIRYSRPNPTGGDIAIPTMILADRNGIIRWIHQTEDYRVRAKPEEVLRMLDRVN